MNSFNKIFFDKERLIYLSFFIIVFSFIVIFFTQVNPIVLLDGDDWTYASYNRLAIPLYKDWNPCRIYPEIFMSFCSNLGLFFIKPFLGDYISSLSTAYGVVVSIFIFTYILFFVKFLKNKFKLPFENVILIASLFLLLHFWCLRNFETNNEYLFYSHNATCYFYYIIPSLHNAILVLYFYTYTLRLDIKYYKNKLHLGLVVLLIYLGVFSNLFPSIILISFLSYTILCYFIKSIKNKNFSIKKLLCSNFISLIAILMWIISLIFEATGGRAESLEDQKFDIVETLKLLWARFYYSFNKFFLCFTIIVIFSCLIINILVLKKSKRNILLLENMCCFFYCGFICAIFQILLCSKTNSETIQRTDILLSLFFYLFMIIALCLYYLLRKFKFINIFMPILLLVIITSTFIGNKTFAQSNKLNLDYKLCKQLDEYLIEQITDADKKHQTKMILNTPVYYNQEDNWPHAYYWGERISQTLYQHDIISKPIYIKIVPDKKINELFDIDTVFEHKVYR